MTPYSLERIVKILIIKFSALKKKMKNLVLEMIFIIVTSSRPLESICHVIEREPVNGTLSTATIRKVYKSHEKRFIFTKPFNMDFK